MHLSLPHDLGIARHFDAATAYSAAQFGLTLPVVKRGKPDAPLIDLPAPRVLSIPLQDALMQRQTAQDFFPHGQLSTNQLSDLLAYSAGYANGYIATGKHRRVVPSAGATYPVNVAVIVQSVERLPLGVYSYRPNEHALQPETIVDVRSQLWQWVMFQRAIRYAFAVVALCGQFERISNRYSERGMRYMLYECGHIAQNFCLVATGLGLGIKPIGGFADDALDILMGNSKGRVLYLMAVGRTVPAALSTDNCTGT